MKVTRRTFLTSSAAAVAGGALIIGVRLHGPFHFAHAPSLLRDPFDTWVRIYPNDRAELVLAKTEMGQGVFTALPMVLAEEAELDWTRISVVQAEECTGTGGSGSVIGSYMPLRQAGAQVREVMILAAAHQWNVPRETCFAQKSRVIHRPSGRALSYGSLLGQARRLPLPDAKKVRLKDPEEFTLLGRPLAHLDIPEKVLGRARFGLDVRPAGLVYAVVARSPKLGGTLADFDASLALKVPRGIAGIGNQNQGWQAPGSGCCEDDLGGHSRTRRAHHPLEPSVASCRVIRGVDLQISRFLRTTT